MKKADNSILFSAVVVTCNDSARLMECLDSLSFCDQLVVVDLNSTDDSVLIAESCGAEIYSHKRVPIIEMIRETAFAYAKYPWIIHVDPDEVFPQERLPEILQLTCRPDIALIRLPCQFYFMNKPLKGTVWGGENSRACIYNNDRIVLSKQVHTRYKLLHEFRECCLVDSRMGAIKHYWVDSYWQMLEKHLRYIKREGEAKYVAGERFTWRKCVSQTFFAFKDSLITCKGWRDGLTGIFLSSFYAWYVAMSYLSLRYYQKKLSGRIDRESVCHLS